MSDPASNPFMVYFGPWKEAGHFMFYETGQEVMRYHRVYERIPWEVNEIDGTLQPGMTLWRDNWVQRGSWKYGVAVIHHKDGWTAMSFWDSTVDTRPGCSSTYIAEGTFTFDQMRLMASIRFKDRWNKMSFPVVLANVGDGAIGGGGT